MASADPGKEAGVLDPNNRERWIGVYIGVLAVMLALCSMGGDNASKNATLTNIEAARQLFRLCLVNGTVDEERVRQIVRRGVAGGRSGSLGACRPGP